MASEGKTRAPRRRSRVRVVLGIVIAILVLMLVSLGVFFVRLLRPPTLVNAENDEGQGQLTWVRSMYGFGPSELEQLLDPTSVAIGPDGEIYATDPQRQRVMVFSSGGAFQRLLHTGRGGMGPRQFVRPESVAVDADGNVYISDPSANKIIVFNAGGQFLREWPAEGTARGVDVQGDNVYVLDVGKVIVYDKQGNKLGEFGSRGRAAGKIDAYQGVTSDGKNIYVADALNHRVQAFDREGRLIWVMPASDPGIETQNIQSSTEATGDARPYDLPQDITLDGAGRLVTIDAFLFEIVVSDRETGKVIARYGTDGAAEGEFFYPSSIAYDPQRDWFAVADTRNNRVQVVRIPGSGGGAASTLRRAMSSPYRYCAAPLALLLLALVIAFLSARRARRRYVARSEAEPPLTDAGAHQAT